MAHVVRRLPYVGLALGTIVVGLAVHRRGGALPPAVRDVMGDALWAAMLAWWIGAALPHVALRTRGLLALGCCWAVEASQLLRTPWLDAWRATTLGHLMLGSDFDARDLLAYAVGVGVAVLVEAAARRAAARV